ncbi:unnamed protein product [Rotaria magnacalcarata]|uniref:Glycosyl hydrolase family 32 C-terminal domain-containing protein n=1 Tax=Rotaria magnacalcarata TaxID=392030 RepID=A0A816THG7_9BILA|nr:unnamed protein product [Rotaria magnacalcarata]
MKATINISQNATAGFTFRRSSNGLEYTTLIYDPVSEHLVLNRTYSSLIKAFDHTIIYAKHTLLTTLIDENTTQKELLSLHIFLDNSLLEIYANNRTVMATHIYPALSDSVDMGYTIDGPVTFSNVSIWYNLKNAFPHRPLNSSIALVVDSNSTIAIAGSIISLFFSFLLSIEYFHS